MTVVNWLQTSTLGEVTVLSDPSAKITAWRAPKFDVKAIYTEVTVIPVILYCFQLRWECSRQGNGVAYTALYIQIEHETSMD